MTSFIDAAEERDPPGVRFEMSRDELKDLRLRGSLRCKRVV
jgi:hypothetical protein